MSVASAATKFSAPTSIRSTAAWNSCTFAARSIPTKADSSRLGRKPTHWKRIALPLTRNERGTGRIASGSNTP